MSNGPDPHIPYPIVNKLVNQKHLVFLKNIVKNPHIIVGDYTYYHDFDDPQNFEKNVLYHFDFQGDKLIIGKFCSIASDVKFIMNGGNHKSDCFTSYPFPIFGNGWEIAMSETWPHKGDTIIGNDVWIGYGAMIMPGIQIGDGAIIGTNALVTRNVEPYNIVGGNPAQVIRQRFPDDIVAELLTIRWWDWDIEKITRNLQAIRSSDINALRNCLSIQPSANSVPARGAEFKTRP